MQRSVRKTLWPTTREVVCWPQSRFAAPRMQDQQVAIAGDDRVCLGCYSEFEILIVAGVSTIGHDDRRIEPISSRHKLIQQIRTQDRIDKTRQTWPVKNVE